MKRQPLLLMVLFMAIISACSAGKDPEKTVTAFVNALNARDWDKAKALATEASAPTIDLLAGFDQSLPDDSTSDIFAFDIIAEKTVINGDSALVTGIDQNNLEMTYELVMVDGEWKIDVGMDKLFGGTSMMEDVIEEAARQMPGMTVSYDD